MKQKYFSKIVHRSKNMQYLAKLLIEKKLQYVSYSFSSHETKVF